MSQPRSPALLIVCTLLLLGCVGWLFLRSGDGPARDATATPGGDSGGSRNPGAVGALSSDGPTAPDIAAGNSRVKVQSDPAVASVVQLTGRFVTQQRAPIADVEVGFAKVAPVGTSGLDFEMGNLLGRAEAPETTVRSSADGRFRLQVAVGRDGLLRLLADHWYLRGPADTQLGGDAQAEGNLRVSALDADRDLGDLVLGRTAGLVGVVQNAAGNPIAGVRVAVTGGRSGLMFGVGVGGAGEQTKQDGRFERIGLRPSEYTVTTASPDYLPARTKVVLKEGEERRDIVITLSPGHTIAGVVVDDLGTPLPGMRVGADRSREVAPGLQVQASNAGEATTTDGAGRFVLRGIDSASVNVEASGPGHARGTVANVVAGTTDIVITLQRYGRIAGRLVDGAGVPLVGSKVFATKAEPSLGREFTDEREGPTTDVRGEFVLEGVVPGSTRVFATGDHLRVESEPIDVRPGQPVEGVRLVAVRGATLNVTVHDRAGNGIAGARVVVIEPPTNEAAGRTGMRRSLRVRARASDGASDVQIDDPTVLRTATTDADGVARLSGLRAGQVVARATEANHAPGQSANVTVPEAGEVEAEITLVVGGFVHLQAFDAARTPLADARYKLERVATDGGHPQTEMGKCDASGMARIGPLTPGPWRARLVLPPRAVELADGMSFLALGNGGHEFAETEAEIDIVAEHTASISLTQPQLATLRGTVRDSQGAVSKAKVELMRAEDVVGFGSSYTASTDATGRFELTGLPPGDYALRYGYVDGIAMSEQALPIVRGEALVEKDLLLRTGTLKLIVHGEGGEPVARARVHLDSASSGDTQRPQREVRMIAMVRGSEDGEDSSMTSISAGNPSATTDAIGEVEITRVPEGKYTLRIEHPRHVGTRKADVQVLDGATVDVGTVTMTPGGELRGRVLGRDGAPVAFATVEVAALPSGEQRSEAAIRGAFRITGLAAGRYRARAVVPAPAGAPGVASEWVEVELGKGQRSALDLEVK